MSNKIQISDEMLSAFLDAELPEAQMQQIRAALDKDYTLADRLAELVMVDEVINTHYSEIDKHALPEELTNLLTEQTVFESTASKVIKLNIWQKSYQTLQKNIALAASITGLLGFSFAYWQYGNTPEPWQEIAQVLETTYSGSQHVLNNGDKITTKLTFINHNKEYCRQFDISNQQVEQSIACRVNNQWQKVSSIYQHNSSVELYQTATSNSLIKAQVENLASGEFIDGKNEEQLITHHWQTK